MAEDVGAAIRKARKARGWTQGHLGSKAGVTESCVNTIENGTRSKTISMWAVLRTLGIESSWVHLASDASGRRKRLGLTQAQLAKKARISASVVFKYEKGGNITKGSRRDIEEALSALEDEFGVVNADSKAQLVHPKGVFHEEKFQAKPIEIDVPIEQKSILIDHAISLLKKMDGDQLWEVIRAMHLLVGNAQ